QLDPAAFEVQTFIPASGAREQYRLFIRFASVPQAVEAQINQTRALWAGCNEQDTLTDQRELTLWQDVRSTVWKASGAIVKISWRPGTFGATCGWLRNVAREEAASIELLGRAGVGTGVVRIDVPPDRQLAVLGRLASKPELVGNILPLRVETTFTEPGR